MATLASCSLLSNSKYNVVYATMSLGQLIQQSQNDFQSAINKQVQQTITSTIKNIANGTSDISEIGENQKAPLSLFQQKVAIIDNVPSQKVKVGDIDMAYKKLGKGSNTVLLITGLGATMDKWSPDLLNKLAQNNTVIIFDNRGAGESTIGSKKFSITQFVNDTVGLLDALNIKKADVLGWSMGAFISQELASTHPDKVNDLILYASSCAGSDSVLPSSEVILTLENKFLTLQQLGVKMVTMLFPDHWFRVNPDSKNYFPITKDFVSREVIDKQAQAVIESNINCQSLRNIASPTMVIVGTEDIFTPAKNSLNIVKEIPGSWLVLIKNAGHGLMYQYPEVFDKVVENFLNATDKI